MGRGNRWRGNFKFQAPNANEASNPKFQFPEAGELKFHWNMEVGAWSFYFVGR